MANDQDVTPESSPDKPEIEGLEVEEGADPLKIEDETPETEESEPETEVKEEDSHSEESKEEEDKPEEPSEAEILKDKLAKVETEKENLKIALQKARQKSPSLAQSVAATPKDEKLTINPEEYVKSLVLEAEQEAKTVLYKEFPQLHPDNDPDNSVYNDFAKQFAVASKVMGITPVTKDHFLQIGRAVMAYKTGGKTTAKPMDNAESKKDAAKAKAADIGGTSLVSKPEHKVSASDADRRAARAAGMPIEAYLKNKDFYETQTI